MNAATPQRRNAATPQRRNAATPQRRNAATPQRELRFQAATFTKVAFTSLARVNDYCGSNWIWKIALIAAVTGCGTTDSSPPSARTSSNIPDPTFGAPHKCGDHCLPKAISILRAQLGIDPNSPTPEQLNDIHENLSAMQVEGEENESLSEATILDLLSDEMRFNSGNFRGVLEDSNGHLHVLLGAINVGDQSVYQLMHGNSGIALVPKNELIAERFPKAWKLRTKSAGVRLAVGSGILLVSELDHNFGAVMPNEQLTHTFTLTNVGKVPLVLTNPNTSCSCTTLSAVENSVLKLGEKKLLTVTVATANAPTVSQFVSVEVTEPETNTLRKVSLNLLGSQWLFRTVSPNALDFGAVLPGRSYSRSIDVTESSTDRFTIIDVTKDDMSSIPLTWNLSQSRNAQDLRVYKINFELKAKDQLPGKYMRSIQLLTDSRLSAKIQVPIQFEVASQVAISPSVIALGQVPQNEAQQQVVRLKAIDGHPIKVTLRSVPSEATVQIMNVSNSVELHVQILLSKSGLWSGSIKADVLVGNLKESVEIKCAGVGKAS